MTPENIELRPLSAGLLSVSLAAPESMPLFVALRAERARHEERGEPLPAIGLDMRCDCSPHALRAMVQAIERAGFTFRGLLPGGLEVASLPLSPSASSLPAADVVPDGVAPASASRRRRARFDDAGQPPVVPVAAVEEPAAPLDAQASPAVDPPQVLTPSVGAQLFTGDLAPGQGYHAAGRDLIVSGAVAPSAEVSADGSVHVYGDLRGRVMAGAAGDRRARIYCLEFHAEIVIIAGHWSDFKEVRRQIDGRSVEIWLEDSELRVRSLGETGG